MIDAPPLSSNNSDFEKTVFVNKPIDARNFDPETKDPSMPSTKKSTLAVGRKRNGYGKALGSFYLPKDSGVDSLVQKALEKAFDENGYKVLVNKKDITKSTFVVDPEVIKFWSWMNLGFWQITLSSEIETNVRLTSAGREIGAFVARGEARERFQTGMTSNVEVVVKAAYHRFIEDAKKKISELKTK